MLLAAAATEEAETKIEADLEAIVTEDENNMTLQVAQTCSRKDIRPASSYCYNETRRMQYMWQGVMNVFEP